MNLATVISLGLGALMFYGITRDPREKPWGQKVAIGCFVMLILIQVVQPDGGCHTEWDGRSNPVICD